MADISEVDGERRLQIADPGLRRHDRPERVREALAGLRLDEPEVHSLPVQAGLETTWDEVCSDFESIHLNWSPVPMPSVVTKHGSWTKPEPSKGSRHPRDPRFALDILSSISSPTTVWVLLSQHSINRDRPLEDIAIQVIESGESVTSLAKGYRTINPFTNSLHVLDRVTVNSGRASFHIIPSRDRGIYQTDFSLSVNAPRGVDLSLSRVVQSLPFSATLSGELTIRDAGGNPSLPSFMINPQFKLVLSGHRNTQLRVSLSGARDVAWNARIAWGKGERVFELDSTGCAADSGPYSFGRAYLDAELHPNTYTLVVSTFEPDHIGKYDLLVESTTALTLEAIPAEGAGMYHRRMWGGWSDANSGGRPSTGAYERNPRIELILPQNGTIQARLHLPRALHLPINLTLFQRDTGGRLGSQLITSGPYDDRMSGVTLARTQVDSGLYALVPSAYDTSMWGDWVLDVWADVPLSTEIVQ